MPRSRARALRYCAWLASCVAFAWLASAPVLAQAPLSLEAPLEGGVLGAHFQVLRDPSHKVTIGEVVVAPGFVSPPAVAPSYGVDGASYWVRLRVRNRDGGERAWLLESGYPHLDQIDLYVPRADGSFDVRRAGDALPFREREIAFRNFLFRLVEPPHSARTYYLHVRTSGSVNLTLRAWSYDTFLAHQARELPLLWMFYGLVLGMAAYNLFLYFSVRRIAYLYYVFYNVALSFCQFTLMGHTFEYLLPNHPRVANEVVLFSMGLAFLCALLFQRSLLSIPETIPSMKRAYDVMVSATIVVAVYGLVGTYHSTLLMIMLEALCLIVVGTVPVVILVLRRHRPAIFYALGWAALFVGAMVNMLKTLGVLPSMLLTDWGVAIGASLEIVLLSLALADRINTMSASVAELNVKLSDNVRELRSALARAEDATRAKAEFLATMSHELRTPLNAIINIPGGLMSAFAPCAVITCGACASVFEREAHDPPITAATTCPHCGKIGAMQHEQITRYCGEPERTLRHLKTIERSGEHLLQMVNGVLDFSKIEAGALKLRLERVVVSEIVDDAVETLSEWANTSGVVLERHTSVPVGASLRGDPLRLKQVMLNLVGNAIKFSRGRGTVTIGAIKEEQSYLFYVRDCGIGIAPEHHERIFERFEQVDRGDTRKHGGTGLGLAIAKSLVRAHEGSIWVESEPGLGSTFLFRVPELGPKSVDVSLETALGRVDSAVSRASARTSLGQGTAP